MKVILALTLGVLLATASRASPAQEGWFLLHHDGHFSISKAVGNSFSDILDIGDQATYGESGNALGVISNKPMYGAWVLYLLDRPSQQLKSSQAINGHLMMQLSGPSRDVVLTSQFAYFITVRFTAAGPGQPAIQPNEQGGSFDFNQLSLANGKLQTFPLPKDCVNPRVMIFDGAPLIYAWEGYGIWKFNAAKSALEAIVAGDGRDLADIRTREQTAGATGKLPIGSFADYVPIPGAGVFRLTRLGELQRVLNADLSIAPLPRLSVRLGRPGNILRVFPGQFNGTPAIGVVRKRADDLVFEYMNTTSLRSEWKTVLSPGAEPNSVFPAPGNAIFYVDMNTGGVIKLSGQQATTVWKLDGSTADFFYTRILRLTDTQ